MGDPTRFEIGTLSADALEAITAPRVSVVLRGTDNCDLGRVLYLAKDTGEMWSPARTTGLLEANRQFALDFYFCPPSCSCKSCRTNTNPPDATTV